jgi:hypothetical protein
VPGRQWCPSRNRAVRRPDRILGPVTSLFEPYVQLVDVTATAALVAWGGFVLEEDGTSWRARRTGETFGARSAPVGRAAVEVLDAEGRIVAREAVDDVNHVWIEGLEPATTYGYRVLVGGETWGVADRHDWAPGGLRPAARPLDLRLRTHAAADQPDPVTFLAVGDAGVGIAAGEDGRRQLAVARTMQRLADAFDVRFVVTLGDTIYHGPGGPSDQSGAAGPNHASMDAQVERLVPLYRRGGARLVLHGHEHNFQHGQVDGLDYVVSGAGGKLDERPPPRTAEAGTVSWAAAAHCLLVHTTPEAVTVTPYGATPPGGRPVPLVRHRPDGSPTDDPIVLTAG